MRQMIVGSDDDGLHAKITSLNMADAHGHIRQEQADERLRLLQNSTGGVTTMIDEVPCRVNKRGQTVRVWKDQFCPMPGHIYPDRAAAVRAVRKGKVEHGGNGGEWASNTKESGGRTQHAWHCNAHTNGTKPCGVHIQLTDNDDGLCQIMVTDWYAPLCRACRRHVILNICVHTTYGTLNLSGRVRHGPDDKVYRRKNSSLTRKEQDYVASSIGGGCPGARPRETLKNECQTKDNG